MKKQFHLFLAILFLIQTVGQASNRVNLEVLGPVQRLRRMSILTTNSAPSLSALQAVRSFSYQENALNNWMKSKTQNYVYTDAFHIKMVDNLSQLFLIRPMEQYQSLSSLHLLFYRIMQENRSWDELLTSSTVGINTFTGSDSNNIDYLTFYKDVATQNELNEIYKFSLDKQISYPTSSKSDNDQKNPDISGVIALVKYLKNQNHYIQMSSPQIAGVLSDPHFLERFWTTPTNQNRKRAAAVFRPFLCDEMKAVILPDETSQSKIDTAGLDVDPKSPSDSQLPLADMRNQHGADPACNSCHYKLDPLAKVFRGRSNSLSKKTVPGQLTFKRKSGELVSRCRETSLKIAKF